MNVCFILPRFSRQPIGGYKMVFEYANRLKDRGYRVVILFLNDDALLQFHVPHFLRKLGANYLTVKEPRWFDLNDGIIKVSNQEQNYERKLQDVDVCVATAVETVKKTLEFPETTKKCYFIQDMENWRVSDEYVINTYRTDMTNIVISEWLKKIVTDYSGKDAILVKNPIDLNAYRVLACSNKRRCHSIGLLYHESEHKGLKYAFEALHILKERYPDLEVEMFGIPPKPEDLPEWIHYTRGASQEKTVEIYNSVQVFLCASVQEGYGLTSLEAMACGAALVSTAYQGILEYAEDGYNALLSPVKEVDGLVNNVSKMFDNEAERDRIVRNGLTSTKEFSWDKAVDKFVKAIES